jgi:hypothetical protein
MIMGWTIQHIPGATENRPCSLVADALEAASKSLNQWHTEHTNYAQVLNELRGRRETEFALSPAETEAIRDALGAAAERMRWRLSARQYLPFLRDLATAADTAARSGKPWRWS